MIASLMLQHCLNANAHHDTRRAKYFQRLFNFHNDFVQQVVDILVQVKQGPACLLILLDISF